ncbi:hypothetical protein JGU71_19250 [Antrihabitans sp. YC3-6]|uniref:Tox-REase-5 domain-containing protein n=1 Tax=Antrihabitans stalagmiti TaxID=2799499 RepID=A0A934U5M8_9NOCA|nr:Tox-REase-5 domain-containing protein [Antrihabitans stalagmiti]MBJ8341028.1 hypothetical protein [Antrihabitans stalagmiti]
MIGAVAVATPPLIVDGSPTQSRESIAREQLILAQVDMAQAPGQRFVGTVSTPSGDTTVSIDLQISSAGLGMGTITLDGLDMQYLGVDGESFLRAPEPFWRYVGKLPSDAKTLSEQWAKIPSDLFGLDFTTDLAPSKLALALDPNEETGEPLTIGEPTDVDGLRSLPITSGNYTTYVAIESGSSATEPTPSPASPVPSSPVRPPHSLAPVPPGASTPPSNSSPGPVRPAMFDKDPGAPAPPPLPPPPARSGKITRIEIDHQKSPKRSLGTSDLNTSNLTPEQTRELFGEMERHGRTDLVTSVDSDVAFETQGQVELAPCGPTSCVANATISNTIAGAADNPKSIYATVDFNFTLDGAPVGSCSQQVVMPPNGSSSTSCPVTYSVPRDGRSHTTAVTVRTTARAMFPEHIEQILRIIAANGDALRAVTEAQKIGEWVPTNHGQSKRAAVYQSQISGLPAGVEYEVNGVKFDGYGGGVLLDAKGLGYSTFFELGPDGQYRPQGWYKNSGNYDKLLTEARNQVKAADGRPIEWHIAEEFAANAIRQLFEAEGIRGVTIVFVPPNP